jgi:hypothetical protein
VSNGWLVVELGRDRAGRRPAGKRGPQHPQLRIVDELINGVGLPEPGAAVDHRRPTAFATRGQKGAVWVVTSSERCEVRDAESASKDFFWGWRTQTSAIGVVCVGGWPCGQESRPQPECRQRRDSAPRGGRCGLLVLTAGPVGVTSTGRTRRWWSRPYYVERSGVLALFASARTQIGG